MECDRCGRTIEGALVSLGARGPFRNLCRVCWGVESRSSNSRLITALNEMTRGVTPTLSRAARTRQGEGTAGTEVRERRRKVVERRADPERPHWHL